MKTSPWCTLASLALLSGAVGFHLQGSALPLSSAPCCSAPSRLALPSSAAAAVLEPAKVLYDGKCMVCMPHPWPSAPAHAPQFR